MDLLTAAIRDSINAYSPSTAEIAQRLQHLARRRRQRIAAAVTKKSGKDVNPSHKRDRLCAIPKARDRRRATTGVVVVIIPWLLEREYRQHRGLDPTGLPKTFVSWRKEAQARAVRMARLRVGRVVRVVIHPGELEAWARHAERPVDDEARFNFAEIVWRRGEVG
jgi:hypothetical protein